MKRKHTENVRSKLSEPVSIVAHQLKNPIAVLKGYLEVLLSEDFGTLNPKQREYINDAVSNVTRMIRIVTDLLDVAKIEAKRYELKPQRTDIVAITRNIIEGLSLWVRAFNSEIIFYPPLHIPLVFADPIKIHQVIENLISNAVKYKSSGRGRVEIHIKPEGSSMVFRCKDNGIGIPRKDFPKVFLKFYRSEDALDIDPTGTGLGLYISKAIIEMSGGKIWFGKNRGKGMTFYFTLPIIKK